MFLPDLLRKTVFILRTRTCRFYDSSHWIIHRGYLTNKHWYKYIILFSDEYQTSLDFTS